MLTERLIRIVRPRADFRREILHLHDSLVRIDEGTGEREHIEPLIRRVPERSMIKVESVNVYDRSLLCHCSLLEKARANPLRDRLRAHSANLIGVFTGAYYTTDAVASSTRRV